MRIKISALVVTLALLGFVTQAQSQCSPADQISPNPNPVGNTISINSGTACNGNTFGSEGTLNNNTGSTFSNFSAMQFGDGGTLNNAGTLNNKVGAVLSASTRGVISNKEFGTLNNFGQMRFGFGGTLNNAGTLNNNVGAGLSIVLSEISNNTFGTLNNAGEISLNISELYNNVGATLNNTGSLHLGDFSILHNSGTLNNTGGVGFMPLIAGLINNGTVNSSGHLGGLTLTNNGTLFNSGGISFEGSLENNSGATIFNNGGTVEGYGFLNNNAGATIYNNGGSWRTEELNNSGTIYNNGGLWQNTVGGLTNNAGATFYNNGGTIEIGGATTFNSSTLNNNAGATLFNNGGTLNNNGGGTLTNNGWINNSGQFLNSGIVTGSGTYTQTAGTTRVDGPMTQAMVHIDGGSLQGVGTIFAPVTVNRGTVSPGNSTGTLTINGDLSFTDGTLLTQISGTGVGQYDVLAMSGAATFEAGTLEFDFSFLPALGDSWNFLTAAGGVWGLENLDLEFEGVPTSYRFMVASLDGGLGLSVTAVPEPEIYAMMGVGLALLGWVGRRRKLKEGAAA